MARASRTLSAGASRYRQGGRGHDAHGPAGVTPTLQGSRPGLHEKPGLRLYVARFSVAAASRRHLVGKTRRYGHVRGNLQRHFRPEGQRRRDLPIEEAWFPQPHGPRVAGAPSLDFVHFDAAPAGTRVRSASENRKPANQGFLPVGNWEANL